MNASLSVIIPVFNRPLALREAVGSVLAQSRPATEILIVDDGSTDDTPATAAALARAHPSLVRVIRIANGGPGCAREAGRREAKGTFIQYLDSDDILYPEKFALQLAALEAHPAAAACYGPVLYRYGDGVLAPDPVKLTGTSIATMFPAFLGGRWWSTHAPLWRREATDRAGPWTNLRIHEDWEYDCRIAATGAVLCRVTEPVAEVREAPTKTSIRFEPRALHDRARAVVLIWEHARVGGCADPALPEAAAFSALTFLLARDCAAVGLDAEARDVLAVSDASAAVPAKTQWSRRLFRTMGRTLGFRVAGSASRLWESLVHRG